MTDEEKEKIAEAFDLLDRHGIYMYVPGNFGISWADDAIEFIENPEKFMAERNAD